MFIRYRMIATLDELTKNGLEQFNLDPGNDLNLTREQRWEMNNEGAILMIDHAEKVLREAFPEADITVDGLGEICALDDALINEETWKAAVEVIQYGPDYDDIVNRYIAISNNNDN